MSRSKFYDLMTKCSIEREVEDVYNKGLNTYFPNATISHPFACDGFMDTMVGENNLSLLIEYKLNEDFTSRMALAKVIIQVVYYLKQFELAGHELPNVILIGDVNECFVMHTNAVIKYLDEELDWNIAPSNAYKTNTDVIVKMAEDEDINPFVYDVDDNFSFKTVAEKMQDLATNTKRYIHITEHNVSNIYDQFCKKVLKKVSKISPNDVVALFIGSICSPEDYYKHPKKANVLVTPIGDIAINGHNYDAFFENYNREYTSKEKDKFAEISDRLIEDTNRRNKGEFYTPTLFVDYAHKMISEQLGEDWKEKYVVWDNCSGTKNLTRDYRFNELYCSTLEQAELEISKKYNKEATAFRFDFLNDDLNNLPKGLLEALEQNKPIVFLLNPPYATSASGKGKEGKGGVSNTMVYEQMISDKIGGASQNLYLQFLYRIMMIKKQYNLTNVYIGLFSPLNFLSGANRKIFRSAFFKEFAYNNGVLFKASHFADVADTWGIGFSIWNSGVNADNSNFKYTLIDNVDGEVKIIGEKVVYNVDNDNKASDWLRTELKEMKEKKVLFPHLSSPLKVVEKENQTLLPNSLGSMCALANNVDKSVQGVAIFSSIQTQGTACISNSIIPQNFNKVVTLFSARKLVESNWANSQDEYLAPNTEHEKWNEFVNDSVVFSLFNSHSQQSSLRQIDYKGKKWDIKNEFFWLPKDMMLSLADDNCNDECYNDCKTDSERYVYTLLQSLDLSEEAKAVLDKASQMVINSFKYRKAFNEENEEYQINNWDCGYYQLKALWKVYMPEEFKEFRALYDKLADKMRPMVYELGFLK